jgi:hypothetical protein
MMIKTMMKAMIMIATPNISPSIYPEALEDEYDPYLQ